MSDPVPAPVPTAYNSRRLLNRTGAVIAIGQVTLFAATIGVLCFTEIPEKNVNVLLVLLGNLASNVTSIVQWFFGGSLSGTTKKPGDNGSSEPSPPPSTATATATVVAPPAEATP